MSISPNPACSPLIATNFRLTSEIELTLRKWANAPDTEYNKEEVYGHKLEIQQVLCILTAPRSLLDGDLGEGKSAHRLTPVSHNDTTTSVSGESGTSSSGPPSPLWYGIRFGS